MTQIKETSLMYALQSSPTQQAEIKRLYIVEYEIDARLFFGER